MFKTKFKSVDELRDFLDNSDFDSVKFCVNPDYIEAVIGISDEGKVVYDYDAMVQHLSKIYEKEADCKEPYLDAVEWIDYNCDMPYWEIVFREESNDMTFDEYIPELNGRFDDYKNTVIGISTHGQLLIDSEFVTDQNIGDIEYVLNDCEVEYKII